jgi:hypothetical protein
MLGAQVTGGSYAPRDGRGRGVGVGTYALPGVEGPWTGVRGEVCLPGAWGSKNGAAQQLHNNCSDSNHLFYVLVIRKKLV